MPNATEHPPPAGLEQQLALRTQELAQLSGQLDAAQDQLKRQFAVTVQVFLGLLELRSPPMAGHSRRVAELAHKLGQALALPTKVLQDLYLAGLLHDIGKIGLADAVLSRPLSTMNGLDKADYSKHAAVGADALQHLDELKDVAHLVRAHHERVDGHGFPDGLMGDEIPLGARILSVANDFDGLQLGTYSEKHLTLPQALEALVQARGKQYDPQVVDALVAVLRRAGAPQAHERTVSVKELMPHMVLLQDLVAPGGALLLAADCELDSATIGHLQDFARRQNVGLSLHVRLPRA